MAELKELTFQEVDTAAGLLARAFEGDPLMQTFFSQAQIHPDDARRELFRYACLIRLHLRWPLLGVVEDGLVRGVACVSHPEEKEWPSELQRIYADFKSRIGPLPSEILEQYAQIVDQHRPQTDHHFLAVLGVDPDHHARGYGRMLLEAVHQLSASHPSSTGIALDTENPANLAFYQRFGYSLSAESSLAGTKIYHFFRPVDPDDLQHAKLS